MNFQEGFLVNDTCIAGIQKANKIYFVYICDYQSGQVVLEEEFEDFEQALQRIYAYSDTWTFQASGCSKHQIQVQRSCPGCAQC